MKKRFAYLIVALLFLVALPSPAFADDSNYHAAWGRFFLRTNDRVEQYHFALLYNFDYGIVPHLNSETLTYGVDEISNWPDENAPNETVVQVVRDFVKAKPLNLTTAQTQSSDSMIPWMNEMWSLVCSQDRR